MGDCNPLVYINGCENVDFSVESLEIKKNTYIHGRNGSGKSTIVNAIRDQLADEFDVQIYTGFNDVVDENQELNAIALGQENVKVKKEIDSARTELERLNALISESGSLRVALNDAEAKKAVADKSLKDAYREMATKIRQHQPPLINVGKYNATDLKRDLQKGTKKLESVVLSQYEEKASMAQLEQHPVVRFPMIDIESLVNKVNELLGRSVTENLKISKLSKDPKAYSFARLGLEIHSRDLNERCAFCDSAISADRWSELDRFFSKASEELQTELTSAIETVDMCKSQVDSLKLNSSRTIYPDLRQKYSGLNDRLDGLKTFFLAILEDCRIRLTERTVSIFQKGEPVSFELPTDSFQAISQELDGLLVLNEKAAAEIVETRENAQAQMRLHRIAELEETYGLGGLVEEFKKAEGQSKHCQDAVSEQEETIFDIKEQLRQLQAELHDEESIMNQINSALHANGAASFLLEMVSGADRGHYTIKDKETGHKRKVTELSTGEMNIIGFLYFVKRLEAPRLDPKPILAVMDDPMNSNDDLYQYLIVAEIEALKNRDAVDRFVVLTHNLHFYLNVLPYRFTKKMRKGTAVYNLLKDGRRTEIRPVLSHDEYYKTSYGAMWADLKFAYENQRPNLMWNTFRRISGTYLSFMGYKSTHIKDTELEETRSLGIALKKSMDVNSHELYDFDGNENAETAEEVLDHIRRFFSVRGTIEHFNRFWLPSPDEESQNS